MGRKRVVLHEGQVFGRLTVVKGDAICAETGRTLAICDCVCGNRVTKKVSSIRAGLISSCGCLSQERFYEKERIGLKSGNRYGRLTILDGFLVSEKSSRTHALCLCECGKKIEVTVSDIRSGNVQSCGCLALETKKANGLKKLNRTS